LNISKLFTEFFNSEKAGGLLLIICTIMSLVITNSGSGEGYIAFWNTDLGGHTIVHWINDGLMAIFFLLIGLELERELYIGELSEIRNALFPVIAAIGGVLLPAAIFIFLNRNGLMDGFGIPMATDIAFAIGMLALLGSRVPDSLKVFLTALAVIDDLCAIIVIALFYSSGVSLIYLGYAAAIFVVLLVLNRLKVHNLIPYLVGGIALWYFMLQSGIHATIAGVLLAFAIPFGNGGEKSPSYILQHLLHKPVAFVIIPLFALANTCILLTGNWVAGITSALSLGIIAGLVIGKPLGILIFSWLSVKLSWSDKPNDLNWNHIIGAGLLAGIGFTMSIFITVLAFSDAAIVSTAKIAILAASLIAALLGLGWLAIVLKKRTVKAAAT
jgi:NhaA family Na+:H+ antiporter